MSYFGNYYTDQQSDGTWICAAHFDNDVLVKGISEVAALRHMILTLDQVNSVHCVQYMKIEKDLKAVKKARSVLAEHIKALVDIAEALEAHDDEGFEVILNNDWQPATHS